MTPVSWFISYLLRLPLGTSITAWNCIPSSYHVGEVGPLVGDHPRPRPGVYRQRRRPAERVALAHLDAHLKHAGRHRAVLDALGDDGGAGGAGELDEGADGAPGPGPLRTDDHA